MPEIGFLSTSEDRATDHALRHFIDSSLTLNTDALKYSVSRRLGKLYPDKAIIQTTLLPSRFREYARADKCTLAIGPRLHAEQAYEWHGLEEGFQPVILNAFYDITWNGQEFHLLTITCKAESDPSFNTWIIADTQDAAIALMDDVQRWHLGLREDILVYDDCRYYRDKDLTKSVRATSFDDIVLPPGVKERMIEDFEQFFASREMYESHNIPWKRGAIFIGPPGNGKTHTLKALINRLGKPTIYVKRVDGNDAEGPASGCITAVFARARMTTPCVLVLEDLDSLVGKSNRSVFLNELDGMSTNNGLLVLATTNHPERIDPAIINRPSRFDRKYVFELPSETERLAFFTMWNEHHFSAGMRLDSDQLVELAGMAREFSYAYLKELAVSMMMRWFNAGTVSADGQSAWDVAREQCTLLASQMATNTGSVKREKQRKRDVTTA